MSKRHGERPRPPGVSQRPSNVRGPKPQSFYAWVRRRAVTDEIERFRCTNDAGKVSIVIVKRGAVRPGVRTLESVKPVFVEALDEKDQVLGTWEMPENAEPEPEPPPAHTPLADDTEYQRDIKVVASLIADAHKHAVSSLKDVIRIQSETFRDERKSTLATVQGAERLVGKVTRLRVKVPEMEDVPEGEEEGWLEGFVGQMIARKMGASFNGAGDEPPEPHGGANGSG